MEIFFIVIGSILVIAGFFTLSLFLFDPSNDLIEKIIKAMVIFGIILFLALGLILIGIGLHSIL